MIRGRCGATGATGLRLNIGCGPDCPDGWVNIDRSPHIWLDRVPALKQALRRTGALSEAHLVAWPTNVVYGDVRRGLPYPDASATAIYSAHMLEHLYLDEATQALRELRRLLAPGGIVRLALPDSERLAADFLAGLRRPPADGADATLAFNAGLNAHPLCRPSGARRLTERLGASTHRWQPTRQLVTSMLGDAGFGGITEHRFLEGGLPDLASVEHRQESFFLEASGDGPQGR